MYSQEGSRNNCKENIPLSNCLHSAVNTHSKQVVEACLQTGKLYKY